MPRKRPHIGETVIAAHADDLARIVPLLGITDLSEFWRRVRNAWTSDQLEDAVRRFRESGDTAAFDELVARDPRTPMGHWRDFANVEARMRQAMAEIGRFPTQRDLKAPGLGGLASAIHEYHGGLAAVRRRMGVPAERAARGEWMDFANVERTLRETEARIGRFPAANDLKKAGLPGLVVAIAAYHGGFPSVRIRLGLERSQAEHGRWMRIENVEAVLRAETAALGRFPRDTDLRDRGHSTMAGAIARHHGGMDAMRRRLGAPQGERPKRYWKAYAHLETTLRDFIGTLGHFPTQKELADANLSTVTMAMNKYHGGMKAVRNRMGYGPVTDETIARHADALATIVPAIGESPSKLWARMKRTWTTCDLDTAVEAHATTGSLDAFRKLLDAPAIPSKD